MSAFFHGDISKVASCLEVIGLLILSNGGKHAKNCSVHCTHDKHEQQHAQTCLFVFVIDIDYCVFFFLYNIKIPA